MKPLNRAERALYRHCVAEIERFGKPTSSRHLSYEWKKEQWKVCKWCGEDIPKEARAHYWHTECGKIFEHAKARYKPVYNEYRRKPHVDCASCGKQLKTGWYFSKDNKAWFLNKHGDREWDDETKTWFWTNAVEVEWDHALAIGVAQRIGTAIALYRAYHPNNLRPLCHDCHVKKTATDRRLMSKLDGKWKPKKVRVQEEQLFAA